MAHDKFGGLTGWDFEGFHQGGDTELWERLGSQVVTLEDDERGQVTGVRFAVWAPNAQRVQVVGPFNWWTILNNRNLLSEIHNLVKYL